MTQNLVHRKLLFDAQRSELPAKRFGTGPLAEMPPHPQRRNDPQGRPAAPVAALRQLQISAGRGQQRVSSLPRTFWGLTG